MKPHNNIDDFFKDNLSHSEIPMSGVEDLWNKLDPNKPRRKFPFFLRYSLGLIGLILAGWFIFNLDSTETNLTETQHDNKSINKETVQLNETSTLSSSILQQENEDLNTEITVGTSNSIAQKSDNGIINDISHNQQDNRTLIATQSYNLGLVTDNKNDSYSYSNLNSKLSNQKDVSLSNFENERMPLATFGLLSVKGNYVLDYSRPLPSINGLLISKIVKPINPVNRQKLWYGQVSATTSFVSNKISFEGMDPVPNPEEWKRAVDPIASFQLDVSLGRQINSKSSINLGLEYQYIDNQYQQDTVIIRTENLYNPEAYSTSSGFRGDSVMVETNTKGTIMRPLRETLINIPLRYNYHIIRKGHFGLDVSLGLIMNLSRQQSGPVLNSNNEWIIVSGQSQNRIGFSYDLSLSAIYTLNIDQSLFLSPRFRHNPSDHLEDLPFNLSRIYVGMELGYRVAF